MEAWEPGGAQIIRTHVIRLRRDLGEDDANPTYIFTLPRVGYRKEEELAQDGERLPAGVFDGGDSQVLGRPPTATLAQYYLLPGIMPFLRPICLDEAVAVG